MNLLFRFNNWKATSFYICLRNQVLIEANRAQCSFLLLKLSLKGKNDLIKGSMFSHLKIITIVLFKRLPFFLIIDEIVYGFYVFIYLF